jgi:hypothetical protein
VVGAAGASPVGSTGTAATGAAGDACTMTSAATMTLSPCRCVPGAYRIAGVCTCQTSTPDVCPTIGCVDKRLDTSNCGACGVACRPDSTCNAGVCGAAPATVSAAIPGCTAMSMVASDAVYFTDAAHGTINKVGAVAPLATNEMGATMLQKVGTNLYWYATGSKKIRTMATTGGAVSDVFTASLPDGGASPDVAGFLVSPDDVTVYISLGTQVLAAPVAGGAPSVVANELHGGLPAALALNGTTSIVYPVMYNGDVDVPSLSAMPATCGAGDAQGNTIMTTCARLARGQGELFPSFIAAIGGRAYWINGDDIRSEALGPIGTPFDSMQLAQTSEITAATATTDAIYFADADPSDPSHGYIEKTALAPNSTSVLLARGQRSPIAIAVDTTKVYWATSDCAILSQSR